MRLFLNISGLFFVALGVIGILKPLVFKRITDKLIKEKDNRMLGIIPLVLGGLYIISSSVSSLPSFVAIVGIIGIFKALMIFFLETERLNACFEWIKNVPVSYYKIDAGLAIVIGLLLLV